MIVVGNCFYVKSNWRMKLVTEENDAYRLGLAFYKYFSTKKISLLETRLTVDIYFIIDNFNYTLRKRRWYSIHTNETNEKNLRREFYGPTQILGIEIEFVFQYKPVDLKARFIRNHRNILINKIYSKSRSLIKWHFVCDL